MSLESPKLVVAGCGAGGDVVGCGAHDITQVLVQVAVMLELLDARVLLLR